MASIKSYNHRKGNASRTGLHAEGFNKATKAGIQKRRRGIKRYNSQILKFLTEGRIEAESYVLKEFIAVP